ncbi:hypothetical protein Adt_34260 [Abeliophyllum distichum]|uniref:Uncharacterized protein n=1 Tax=Abeliophyllum distichum TaxID=126358 RepID=A0ABD1QYL7_9LAMI
MLTNTFNLPSGDDFSPSPCPSSSSSVNNRPISSCENHVSVPFMKITDAKNNIVPDNQSNEEGKDRKGDPNFPSQTIKILGVTIPVSNNKEKDDVLKEHNLEINQKDCTETSQLSSNRKSKATEFNDYLSSENNTINTVAFSQVQEFNSGSNIS